MDDCRWHSFWFAYGEHPCHVTAVAPSHSAAAVTAANEAYHWLTAQHGRFDLSELRFIQGTSEPLHAQEI